MLVVLPPRIAPPGEIRRELPEKTNDFTLAQAFCCDVTTACVAWEKPLTCVSHMTKTETFTQSRNEAFLERTSNCRRLGFEVRSANCENCGWPYVDLTAWVNNDVIGWGKCTRGLRLCLITGALCVKGRVLWCHQGPVRMHRYIRKKKKYTDKTFEPLRKDLRGTVFRETHPCEMKRFRRR